MKNRLTVERAAELMNCSKQFIRIGIQQGKLPFGTCVKISSEFTYFISKIKFEEFTGIKVVEDE